MTQHKVSNTWNGMIKKWSILSFSCFVVLSPIHLALASGRSLDSASKSAVTIATQTAQGLVLLGFLVAAILYNIPGLVQYARRTMVGALIGALCAFGGPTFIHLMRLIFGA